MVFIPLLNCKGYSNSNNRNSNCNKIKKFKKTMRKIKSFFGIPRDFYSCHLYSSSSLFNLCSSWNINVWNSEKRDGVMYLNFVFKPVCICLQETGKSKFLSKGNSPSILGYNSLFHRANSKILEREVYISMFIILVLTLLKTPITTTLYQLV